MGGKGRCNERRNNCGAKQKLQFQSVGTRRPWRDVLYECSSLLARERKEANAQQPARAVELFSRCRGAMPSLLAAVDLCCLPAVGRFLAACITAAALLRCWTDRGSKILYFVSAPVCSETSRLRKTKKTPSPTYVE